MEKQAGGAGGKDAKKGAKKWCYSFYFETSVTQNVILTHIIKIQKYL